MNLFIFFAIPLATILLAIVLQKLLRAPILVAITFFAIFLIISFVAFSDTLAEAIIASIIYTILAYITAYIVKILCKCRRRFCNNRVEQTNECEEDNILSNQFCNPIEENCNRAINNTTMNRNIIQRRRYIR